MEVSAPVICENRFVPPKKTFFGKLRFSPQPTTASGVATTRHHFFVLASNTMPFFDHAEEKVTFVEQFFDTAAHDLLRARCWLSKRDDKWFLKKEVLPCSTLFVFFPYSLPTEKMR